MQIDASRDVGVGDTVRQLSKKGVFYKNMVNPRSEVNITFFFTRQNLARWISFVPIKS